MQAGRHELRIASLVIVALTAVACAKASAPSTTLPDAAAADYITAAFKTHPLVAFSEPGHGAPSRLSMPSAPSSNEIQD
jgi:hypothetical protein